MTTSATAMVERVSVLAFARPSGREVHRPLGAVGVEGGVERALRKEASRFGIVVEREVRIDPACAPDHLRCCATCSPSAAKSSTNDVPKPAAVAVPPPTARGDHLAQNALNSATSADANAGCSAGPGT